MKSSQVLGGDGAQWTASLDGDEPGSQSDGTVELGQMRSQNGNGCGDLPDKHVNGQSQKDDPFAISFDGDDDPMCPRSSE
jgi:hypothetical protein